MWIAPPQTTVLSTGVFLFRKTLTLDKVPSMFSVNVSADNRFVLFVNGVRMATGPARGDLAHWRYEVIDLAPALHVGKNVISALVWDFGSLEPLAQIGYRMGFVLWSNPAMGVELKTDATWDVHEQTGWTFADPGTPVGSAVGPNETIDASRVYTEGEVAKEGSAGWVKAVVLGHAIFRDNASPSDQDGWMLMQDPLPKMEEDEISAGSVVRSSGVSANDFPSQSVTIAPHTHATILLDRKILMTAYPILTVSEGKGSIITMTYAEALYDDHNMKGNRNEIAGKHMNMRLSHDTFLPDGSNQRRFEPLWWRTWRYVQLDIDTNNDELRLDSLKAFFTVYPLHKRASFESNAPVLSRIWDVGWWTTRLDAHETYMDCPYWEQLQYIGDSRIEALTTYIVSGDGLLGKEALLSFGSSMMGTDLTESRYPTRLKQIIPTFSLLWIGMLHDYWWYRPDDGTVRELLPATRLVLGHFAAEQRPDGLMERLSEDRRLYWNFIDWAKDYHKGLPPQDEDGGSVPISLQYAIALRQAADLEDAFGDPARAKQYRVSERRIAKSVYAETWDPNRGLLRDTPKQAVFSQQSNILGILADAIPAEQQTAVLGTILKDELDGLPAYPGSDFIPASYYFRFYLARALDHAGDDDLYLKLLGPWKRMLDLGLSTWAEEAEPTRSDAHAWSAHPTFDLLTLVAGVSPNEPGFRSVKIAPHLGDLKELTVTVPVPQGNIHVKYAVHGKALQAHIDLPAGLHGVFEWAGNKKPLNRASEDFTLQPR